MSHPVWVCGLKHISCKLFEFARSVTPCMGVWIETRLLRKYAPRQGSHPVWVCGLKPGLLSQGNGQSLVTPCMGVWIETNYGYNSYKDVESHTLYGCVD